MGRPKKIVCATDGCKNAVKEKYRKKCYKCRNAEYREKNPIRWSYFELKKSAKRREKEFDLTFEQWKNFCITTGYHLKKGVAAENLHVDRINPYKGYTISNIQVLTAHDNCSKRHYEYTIPEWMQPRANVPF